VFIVANSRPGANTFLDYAKKVRLEFVALGALSSAASTALLQSLVQRSADASQQKFVRWCLGVAEGNPFFLQELAHQWIETGHRYEAPPSVSKVLQERLSRLTVEALQVLQVCSVLGEWATIERVEGVLMYRPHQLLSAVEELSNAAMLVAHPEGSESSDRRLHPRHDFLASAAIGRLSPLSLAFLHQRSADVLDKEIPRTGLPTTLLWACANHSHL